MLLLLVPFFSRYDYMRQAENMAANLPMMKPPRDDLFAPDLYIPLHSVFTYVVLTACNRFIAGYFQPEVMYNMVRPPLCSLCVELSAAYSVNNSTFDILLSLRSVLNCVL